MHCLNTKMQKKFISQWTPKRIHSLLALKTFLIILFFYPFLYSARTFSNDGNGTNSQQQSTQGKIFISTGAIVTGAENIHNGEIIIIKETAKKSITSLEKNSFSKVIVKAITQKKESEKPKKENIVRKLDFNVYNSPAGSSDFIEKRGCSHKAIVPSTNLLQKNSVINSCKKIVVKVNSQLRKHTSYTIFFFLQLRELRNYSLRGPPYLS